MDTTQLVARIREDVDRTHYRPGVDELLTAAADTLERQLVELKAWHPGYISDTGTASTVINSGHGEWCHHESCHHWFEPQCARECGSASNG